MADKGSRTDAINKKRIPVDDRPEISYFAWTRGSGRTQQPANLGSFKMPSHRG